MLGNMRINKQTMFEEFFTKGHERFMQKKFDQALKNFQKAQKHFKLNEDELYRLVDMRLDQSRIYKARDKFQKAKQILQNCQKTIKDYYRGKQVQKNKKLQKMESQLKVYTQMGQVLADQIEKSIDNENNVQKINKCIDYYAKAIEIAASVLGNQENYSMMNQQQISAWQQLYAQSIISSIDPILIQAQKYKDSENHLTYKLIYKIADKMGKFYQFSHKSSKVTRQNARSWYYRGSMLLKTSTKYKQIYNFLALDYKYCSKHNLQQDLKKTKISLIKYYNRLQNFQKVRELFDQKNKQAFNQQNVSAMKKLKNYEDQFKSKQFLLLTTQQKLRKWNEFVQILQDQQFGWWARLPPVSKLLIPLINDQIFLFQLCYSTATAYYELFNELNAINYCNQCKKYCQEGSQDYIQMLILQSKILFRSENFQKLKSIEKQLQVVTQNDEDFEKKVKDMIQIRENRRQRNKFFESKLLQSQAEKKLFSFLTKKKQQTSRINEINIDQSNENNRTQITFMTKDSQNFMRIKQNKQILLQKYKKLCKQRNIPQRKYVLDQINKLPNQQTLINLNLNLLFQVQAKQLQIYLEITNNNSWDFRNHKLDQYLFKKFVQKVQDKQIFSLKLANLNKLIPIQKFQQLMFLLRNLQQLHLQKLDRKFVTKKINKNLLGLPFCGNIKILKLKKCYITDNLIQQICNTYADLVQLDLASNQLSGSTLFHINKLKNLQKLNISYNPISSINNLWNKSIKKLKLKKLKINIFKENIYNCVLFRQIKLVRILDMSQNAPQVVEKILYEFNNFLIQNQCEEFQDLYEIRLKKCQINQKIFSQLNQILNFARLFKHLDIRFSWYDEETYQKFIAYQNKCGKYINVDNRGHMGTLNI